VSLTGKEEAILPCPKNASKLQKKPIDQAKKLDTIGFSSTHYS